jgi:large subunit ribosomal protein L15
MKYNELQLDKNKQSRRVGRGIAAGQGKTAGRGTKGQNARTGGARRPGFEGGQTPLMQLLPKSRGFRSIRPKAEVVYTGQLDDLGAKVDNFTVFEAGITSSPYVKVKLVTNGEVTKKVTIALQGASAGAIAAVKKAGGTFTATERLKHQAKEKVAKEKITKK